MRDRARLGARLRQLRERGDAEDARGSEALEREIRHARERRARRAERVPAVTFPESLPVARRRGVIAEAIRDHQVVVVCGETGSGKTTQLPKICLELGRGVDGMIGHTQPRRLAARAVANRIAKELRVPLGKHSPVGFQVRFDDRTGDDTLVKLMTDGVLLNETQRDRNLLRYDTIIVDEAHERSLNIDFLLGYLARLLPRRPDLRLIVTSATINPRRFAEHFAGFLAPVSGERPAPSEDALALSRERAGDDDEAPAGLELVDADGNILDVGERWGGRGVVPVVSVSGRTFPVEVRHLEPDVAPEEEDDRDVTAGVLAALDDIVRSEKGAGVHGQTRGGDVLVFLAGEREIRETAKAIRERKAGPAWEVLPLYARLAAEDQDKVFAPTRGRRVILATNIAETSVTVPGITYVIDPGQARMARYAARSRVQRLPVEAVSQASADQRKGRCGRVAPGVCYRLYSEEDFAARPAFTDPEILRTNLAGVILQMKALGLGSPGQFPFLDAPKSTAVREGEQTLHELGATDDVGELTELGRKLARLPVDPRIGRMILAGEPERCEREVLIIASALSIQDPRERPAAKRDAADRAHEQLVHEGSDFLSYLKLWDWFHAEKERLGSSKLKKLCIERFINYVRMREWLETYRQLRDMAAEAGVKVRAESSGDPDAIHRALLSGLLSSIGFREGKYEYSGPGGSRFMLWPGSALFGDRPKWVVAAEVVETDRAYARTVGPIDPEWVEDLGAHLVTRSYSDPRFHPRKGKALANEKVSLSGLTLIPQRQVDYGPIDPRTARELFIYHGLVLEEWETDAAFREHNRWLIERVEELEAKKRKRDVLVEHHVRFAFYDERVPEDVYTGETFERWLQRARRDDRRVLFMTEDDLMAHDASEVTAERFPDEMAVGETPMPLSYKLEPGEEDDGVTVTVPVEALGQLDDRRASWLVPGMVADKIAALIRTLPKDQRRALVPAPDVARKAAALLGDQEPDRPFVDAVAEAVKRVTGNVVPRELWKPEKLPGHFRMNVRVVDESGEVIEESRDISELKRKLQPRMRSTFERASDERWKRDNITDWDFGELPETVTLRRGDVDVRVHPALVDDGRSVKLRLFETREAAARAHRTGLRRLFDIRASEELRSHAAYLPEFDEIALHYAPIGEAAELRRGLRLLLADQLFIGDRVEVRDQRAFDARLEAGWHRIGETTHAVCDLALGIVRWHTTVRGLLDDPPGHLAEEAVADLREQLAALVRPGFFASVPAAWLVHYPRYLRAMELRIDRAGRDRGERDRALMGRVLPHWKQYLRVLEARPDAREASPAFDELGWMIEEFRVSLFAQDLRTSIPVSERRLNEQWPKCRL